MLGGGGRARKEIGAPGHMAAGHHVQAVVAGRHAVRLWLHVCASSGVMYVYYPCISNLYLCLACAAVCCVCCVLQVGNVLSSLLRSLVITPRCQPATPDTPAQAAAAAAFSAANAGVAPPVYYSQTLVNKLEGLYCRAVEAVQKAAAAAAGGDGKGKGGEGREGKGVLLLLVLHWQGPASMNVNQITGLWYCCHSLSRSPCLVWAPETPTLSSSCWHHHPNHTCCPHPPPTPFTNNIHHSSRPTTTTTHPPTPTRHYSPTAQAGGQEGGGRAAAAGCLGLFPGGVARGGSSRERRGAAGDR